MSSVSGSEKIPEVRLWKIQKNQLVEIIKPKLDLEERLENWIESDIEIIAPNLLVIGRQLETDYGGVVDLLCIDDKGDLTIIELKRDKTPREITAQIIDYASWVKHLSPTRVQSIAEKYLNRAFDEAFLEKFNQELPEGINEEHKMLVVGSEIDSSSRRIINYLSETYGVSINAVTFNYFNENGQEFLARTFLIEKERAKITKNPNSKRIPNLTFEQLQNIANERGVGDTYSYLFNELQSIFQGMNRTRSSISFTGQFRTVKRASIFNLIPKESDSSQGLRWQVYALRFKEHFNLSNDQIEDIIPKNKEPWTYGTPGDQSINKEKDLHEQWSGYTGTLNLHEAKQLIEKIKKIER
jgi:hypothetical protein